ncbi:MAG TPA: response regulator transcription factor [Chloroflexota bacterium]|nr:response regulator transcription factor [Chloroflexota bacterium]
MSRILLVDDHEIVRRGLAEIIATVDDLEVAGECAGADDLAAVVSRTNPDLVLLDVRMPGRGGAALCEDLLRRWPGLKVVMLSTFIDEDAIHRCLLAGARGYLLKDIDAVGLLEQLRAVLRGELVLHPQVTGQVVAQMQHMASEGGQERPTGRELEVLRAVARGLTSREVADELIIAESTVKTHIQSLMRKLNAANRAELVAEAMRRRLL